MSSEPAKKAKSLKAKYAKRWLAIEGVVAVGVGMRDERACIIVSVEKDLSAYAGRIPHAVEGIPVFIEYSGEITAR